MHKILIAGLFWVSLLSTSLSAFAEKSVWTETQPAINLTHIFKGEINRRGKPTGLHAKFNGQLAKGAKILKVKGRPNQAGVYTAEVAVQDAGSGQWKSKFSSIFPDKLQAKDVLQAILHAYKHRHSGSDAPWRGPSGLGFPIEGYLSRRGGINTAYPIYIRDRKRK